MTAVRCFGGAHKPARREVIDVLVAQALDDIEVGRLDLGGAARLVAEIAWDEACRLPLARNPTLGCGDGPVPPPRSLPPEVAGVRRAPTDTDHRESAVGALVAQALGELDARPLPVTEALENLAARAWDAATAAGDV